MKVFIATISALLCALLLLVMAPVVHAAAPQQAPPDPADAWARVQKAGKLSIGTAADYPPFEFYNSNFALDGFDIALARALGEELGVEVEFNDYAFDGLLDQVQLGNVDAAIAAISVTPERSALVDFTNLYYIGNSAVVAGSAFTPSITSAADLAGLKVGVQLGTTYQQWAQEQLVQTGYIPQENLVGYHTASEMLTDLRNGKVDVGLMGKLSADLAIRNRQFKIAGEGLSAQRFAIALPKGSSLVDPLNRALLALESDGKFAALSKQYLSETPEQSSAGTSGAVVTTPPAVTSEPQLPQPTATPAAPACIYSMKWIADLNLDDKNMQAPPIMIPGQDFAKGWRVLNNGTCAWPADFALAYAYGNRIEAAMGGSSMKVGREVKPGEQVDITVNLRAPQTYGVFQGFWQMRDAIGQSFGETVWAGVQVPDPNPPVVVVPPPVPPGPAAINANLRADSAYIASGQCTTIRWDVDNVQSVFFIDGGNQQGVGGHDARNVCPGGNTTYTLRVVGNDGATHDFPVTVNVNGNANYSINYWTDRDNVDAGQCTTLRWDVRNVQAVYLNNEGVAGVSQREVCPSDTKTYRLTVTKNDGGQESREVTVHVNNSRPKDKVARITRFDVDRNPVFVGECIKLEWRTDDAEGVSILRNGDLIRQADKGNGSYEDCYASIGVNDYELQAYNRGGGDTRYISVPMQDAGD